MLPPSLTRSSPPWLGWALALTATTAFSIATPLSRFAILVGMTPTNLLLARLWLSSLLLGSYVLWIRPGQMRLDRRAWIAIGVVGIASGVSTLAYFEALRYLDSSLAVMLFAANPVVVLGLLAMRGEPLTQRHWSLLFLQEQVTVAQACGAGFILVSALLAAERWGLRRWSARRQTMEVAE